MIQGTCGRTFIGSSVPPATQDTDLLWSWENRLRERLATIGSTEFALIWREKVSPQGLSISRLAPSTRHTNATGSTGALWSTPRASDGEKGGPSQSFTAGGQPLPAQMYQAFWVTASSRDWKDSPGMATETGDRNRIDQLPRQMSANASYHPTPLSLSFKDSRGGRNRTSGRSNPNSKHHDGMTLTDLIYSETGLTGQTPSGSTATTARRGAPNPIFAFWLMGFPAELISGALEAMRSYRKPRRKSSAR